MHRECSSSTTTTTSGSSCGRSSSGPGRPSTTPPNGRDGLREFHAWRPDLVVLDVNMPEMDGWNVLERIRDMSEVPVLMLTARGEELERVRGLQSGADDYVVKPFGKQELVARVQALAPPRRARRAARRRRRRTPTPTCRSTGRRRRVMPSATGRCS